MTKWKALFTNYRVILLIVAIIFSVLMIRPQFGDDSLVIAHVMKNSPAQIGGLQSPDAKTLQINYERIMTIDGITVKKPTDLAMFANQTTLTIQTNKQLYTIDVVNTSWKTFSDIGLDIRAKPRSNIRTGIDISGGSRILLEPNEKVSSQDLELIRQNIEQRINAFGLADARVMTVEDAAVGQSAQYIVIEVAQASDQIATLVTQQGKFEAKIANKTIFTGADVSVVVGQGQFAGITAGSCGQVDPVTFSCGYQFPLTLSAQAARAQAMATANLSIVTNGQERQLSEKLYLYLDDQLVNELFIAADLRGQEATQISISGGATAESLSSAQETALGEMKQFQTILRTGNMPTGVHVIKTDVLSARLGNSFLSNAIMVGLLGSVAVFLVILLRYRDLRISIPITLISLSEIFLLLGFAAISGWNIDLASIAALIIIIGSSIDHQIIITDEVLSSKKIAWKSRMKNAFSVIIMAFITNLVSLLPIWSSGAGLLRGFAFTTIMGLTLGLIFTRPCYAAVAEILLRKDE